MIWLYGTTATVNKNHLSAEVVHTWDRALPLKDGPLALSLFTKRRNNLLNYGFANLKHFGDLIQEPQKMPHALNQPQSLETITLKELEDYIICTFPEEDALRNWPAWRLRSHTYNATVEPIYKPEWDQENARYTSNNQLLTLYSRKGQEASQVRKKARHLGCVLSTAWCYNGLPQ